MENTIMKLSILVTYYNQEKFVSRSLDSIFSQNIKSSFEVLVGDDGSQDNTVNIVKQYQKKFPDKIKLFIMPRDINKKYFSVERASLNRINLLKNASGEYVCFLDGDDDYCNNDFMQCAIDELDNNSKNVGIAFNYVTVNESGLKVFNEKIVNKNYITLKDYLKDLYIHVGAIVFRKPHLNELKEVTRLKSFDDNGITYFFLNKGIILYRNINVYNYHSNNDSICHQIDDIEMKLLNAIDYHVLKQIIKRNHFLLFIRYFDTRFYIFKNIKKLFTQNKKIKNEYIKWEEFCNDICINYILFKWYKLNVILKILLSIKIYILKVFHSICRIFIRVKRKLLKIIQLNNEYCD